MYTHRTRTKMPFQFYLENAEIAKRISELIRLNRDALPEIIITQIEKLVTGEKQTFQGAPTFARAVLHIIEKLDVSCEQKLALIWQTARITVSLGEVKAFQLN